MFCSVAPTAWTECGFRSQLRAILVPVRAEIIRNFFTVRTQLCLAAFKTGADSAMSFLTTS